MIVVEGCDGTGKSTLVQDICKEFDLNVGVRGTTDRDKLYEVTFTDTMRAIATAITGPSKMREDDSGGLVLDRPLVWDRLFFSDFVYAPIQNRQVAFNKPSTWFIQSVMEAMRCPVIYCRPPEVTIFDNVKAERHQMQGVRDNVETLIAEYDQMFRHHKGKLNLIEYDYTEPGDRYRVFATIAGYIDHRRDQRAGLA